MTDPYKNPPKTFFNFFGPESDNQDYKPTTPETHLTLAVPVSREGLSKAAPTEKPKTKEVGVRIFDDADRKLTVSVQPQRVGSASSPILLDEEDSTDKKKEIVEENPDVVEVDPDSPVAGLTAKGSAQPSGSCSNAKKRRREEIVMPERTKDRADLIGGNLHGKKIKITEVKKKA